MRPDIDEEDDVIVDRSCYQIEYKFCITYSFIRKDSVDKERAIKFVRYYFESLISNNVDIMFEQHPCHHESTCILVCGTKLSSRDIKNSLKFMNSLLSISDVYVKIVICTDSGEFEAIYDNYKCVCDNVTFKMKSSRDFFNTLLKKIEVSACFEINNHKLRDFIGDKRLSDMPENEYLGENRNHLVESIRSISSFVPVFYKDPEEMISYNNVKEDDIERLDEEDDEYRYRGKYIGKGHELKLGYYSHREINGIMYPVICLCPELIEQESKKDTILKLNNNPKENYKTLYEMVYVHELGHALMDRWNELSFDANGVASLSHPTDSDGNVKDWKEYSFYKTLPEIAMEESMANCIALDWFGDSLTGELDNGTHTIEYEVVRKFIESQPTFYSFGWHQHRAGAEWNLWYDFKNEHIFTDGKGKRLGVDSLRKWFHFTFSRGCIRKQITDNPTNYSYDPDFLFALQKL